MSEIKVYIIARISEDAHLWTDKVCDNLDNTFKIFKPKDHNPWNKRHELFSKNVFDVDLDAMKNSHLGLMLLGYGNDCAWEAGWYANSEKPVAVFVDTDTEWFRDWMIKGGIDYVITNNPATYKVLKEDPILQHKKIIQIQDFAGISEALKEIYKEHYDN